MAWRSTVGRWLGAAIGGVEGRPGLHRVQQHLATGEGALAWAAAEELRGAQGLDAEAYATLGVAASAVGRFDEATQHFEQALAYAPTEADAAARVLAAESLLARAKALAAQSRGEQGLLCGPLWRAIELPAPPVPPAWTSWSAAMPCVADYVGPVAVRWSGEPASGQRGLFATRALRAGELLLVASPIAQAETTGAPLLGALGRACQISARARRRLACLADGSMGGAVSPEDVMAELGAVPDVAPVASEACMELNFRGIVDHNVFTMEGWAAVYGLPSMLNHTCDGTAATALKLGSRVLPFLGGAIVFVAARDVAEGEELCHQYFDVAPPASLRRELSGAFGFACACRRCVFELSRLPGSGAATAVEDAKTVFRESLKPEMQELMTLPQDNAGVRKRRRALLREVLRLARTVQLAAEGEEGWREEDVGWTLALIQPLSNSALFCLFTHKPAQEDAAEIAADGFAPEGMISLRCEVLGRIVAAWRHSEFLGFDHMKNLQLYWVALDEVRVRSLAAALADAASVGAGDGPQAPLGTGESVPWSRLQGAEFREAVKAKGLQCVLDEQGGFLQVTNFLDDDLASQALEQLQLLGEDEWALSSNQTAADADHRFWRYDGMQGAIGQVKKAMLGLVPPKMHHTVQAARYDAGGKITLHNDAMNWVIQPHQVHDEERYPAGTSVYRKVALICYFTRDWQQRYGGCFVDNMAVGPRVIVPLFNSLVLFTVPREHCVTEVAKDAPMRYTLFGWFNDLEAYPPGCPSPLGSGNPEPGGPAAPGGPAGGASGAAAAATPPAVAAAGANASEARARCEEAFCIRFGVEAGDLQLGLPGSQASILLRRLQAGEAR